MATPSASLFVRYSAQRSFGAWHGAHFAAGRAFCTASSPSNSPHHAHRSTTTQTRPRTKSRTRFAQPANTRLYSATINATPQPTDSGITRLSHRRLITISGPDAAKFLQGLVTNNVHAGRTQPFFAAFLDSRGRVLWDVFVWVYPDLLAGKEHWSCHVEVDASEAEALRKHLKRHKLRSKVNIELVPEEDLSVWAAWGQSYNAVNPQAVIADLRDPRGDMSTLWRILAKPESCLTDGGAELQGLHQYHLQRYRQGIAEGPGEISRESALPMEFNIDLAQGIDFKKGCYIGQELTIRTKHTGVVRKRVLPVQLKFPAELCPSSFSVEPGTDIKQLDETGAFKKGRATGKLVASIGDIGLALCRLEMMTPMRVSNEGGSYRQGMQFGISVGQEGRVVEVIPVLRDWFTERESLVWAKSKPKSTGESSHA